MYVLIIYTYTQYTIIKEADSFYNVNYMTLSEMLYWST